MDRVWVVTGANSGFGRAFTEAAIASGDVVVAAVRRPQTMSSLQEEHPDRLDVVQFDVTDTANAAGFVDAAAARHGRIDVLVNNAGRAHVGAAEDTSLEELRDLFQVHFFGAVELTRAVLPHMRGAGAGAIVQLSSMGGQMSFAGFSAYSATKFALEGWSEALADEVREYGIDVLIVEPGAFRTSLFDPAHATVSAEGGAYAATAGSTRTMIEDSDGTQAGDPAKLASLVIEALASDSVPLRLPVGTDAIDAVKGHLDATREQITRWESRARATALDRVEPAR
jgi:NAD(P)-dependent dehydrogenase (short-subunit alcohol dehydrogenase family)